MLEKFLYVNIISTEMTVFNAKWVFNTIQAAFPDIIPVPKTVGKGDWHRPRELKNLRQKSERKVRERDIPFRKARALLTVGHGNVPGRALRARRKAGRCGLCHLCLRWDMDLRYEGAETRYFVFVRCLMSASSRQILLGLRAIEDSRRLPDI